MDIKIKRIVLITFFSVLTYSKSSTAGVFYYPDTLLMDSNEENQEIWDLFEYETITIKSPAVDSQKPPTQVVINTPPPDSKPSKTTQAKTSNSKLRTSLQTLQGAGRSVINKTAALLNNLSAPRPGDKLYLRLLKRESKLEMWYQRGNKPYQLYKTFDICTYSGGLGPKVYEGDEKSPEGFYATRKNMLNPNSRYHLSFNIGYPNAYDRANGHTGKFIMVHGDCKSIGCYAMTDSGIEEIYSIVQQALNSGQSQIPIHIFPFAMDDKNMKYFENSQHYAFWKELKPAYDIFEKQRRVPNISVENRHYQVQ